MFGVVGVEFFFLFAIADALFFKAIFFEVCDGFDFTSSKTQGFEFAHAGVEGFFADKGKFIIFDDAFVIKGVTHHACALGNIIGWPVGCGSYCLAGRIATVR